MTLEQDFVWIEIWSGSIVLKNSVHIKTLTGYVPSSYVYSINNYMIIVIQAGDISATSIPGITFSWIQGIVKTLVKIYGSSECKILNIFLPPNLSICFGCSKEPSH